MMLNFKKMPERDIKKLLALLLAVGYLDIGAIEISKFGFRLVLRGPIFWRLTSGMPPYLHSTGAGPAGRAYLQLEALVAYLLLIDEVYLTSATVGASTIVGIIGSKWFTWRYLQKMLRENRLSFKRNRIILMVLNLVVGLNLFETRHGLTLTGLAATIQHEMAFVASSRELTREQRILPSLLTPPIRSPQLGVLNKLVGALLMIQQLRVVGIYVGRGGELGFGISGDMLRLKVLPQLFKQKMAAAKTVAGNREGSQDQSPAGSEDSPRDSG